MKRLFIDEKVKGLRLTEEIREKWIGNITFVDDVRSFVNIANRRGISLEQGKESLLITENKGSFLKDCPGTNEYICCGYKILNIAGGCPFDCSYCILQAYLNNPFITLYTNLDDMFEELNSMLNSPNSLFRIGTGELTDSLALEGTFGFTKYLIPYFAAQKKAVLELKTKSVNIEPLLSFEHDRRVIISWSLNSSGAEAEEFKAPSVTARIKAAKRCKDAGYLLGFHFDPLFYSKNWFEGYRRTADELFKNITPDSMVWISLGAFRFIPSLKKVINSRFPESKIQYQEFILAKDKKMRYLQSVRVELYSRMLELIRSYSGSIAVYLCMESEDVWSEVFGSNWEVTNDEALSRYLDEAYFKKIQDKE